MFSASDGIPVAFQIPAQTPPPSLLSNHSVLVYNFTVLGNSFMDLMALPLCVS
jgi:hypothetical protein